MPAWTFGAVGDVFINRPDPANAFRHCAPLLRQIDLLFGNCEGAFTNRPQYAPSAGWRVVAGEENGRGLQDAGFHVMACANNHILDAGHEGLADTLRLLRQQNIATVGAGRDVAEAHAPAFAERAGLRIGFLAYASVYQAGYEARKGVPGLAPLRIHSHYYIPDWDAYGKVEPGAPPQVRTIPYPEDIEKLKSQIADTRTQSDVTIVSFHWGQASSPAKLTDYERNLGRAAIDFGADVVLGHHHHFLRGIEVYNGKPIFYGLGHFVFDLPGLDTALTPLELAKLKDMGEFAIYPRAGYPFSPFHADARKTMVGVCAFDDRRLMSVGFVPCMLNEENHAIPVKAASPEGQAIVQYMEQISETAGMRTRYHQSDLQVGRFQVVTAAAR
jgi:poly-gamma-glutamate capsule biosynthesis protein CapA/YwtB (metallophosphatase superfamily)